MVHLYPRLPIHYIENYWDSKPSGIAVANQSVVECLNRLHGLP